MALLIYTLLPVASFHSCFLVPLKSERDYDTTICIRKIYSLSFYVILSFSYFPLPPRQKTQTLHYKEGRVAPKEVTESLWKLHPWRFSWLGSTKLRLPWSSAGNSPTLFKLQIETKIFLPTKISDSSVLYSHVLENLKGPWLSVRDGFHFHLSQWRCQL